MAAAKGEIHATAQQADALTFHLSSPTTLAFGGTLWGETDAVN